jgi:hypothetical protein
LKTLSKKTSTWQTRFKATTWRCWHEHPCVP